MNETIDDERLAPLWKVLSAGRGECPFVVDKAGAEFSSIAHFDGGRDAAYVVVARKSGARSPANLAVTIGYAPSVEGTSIIYDVTDQTMQGKARPFTCVLRGKQCRVYALLPYQVEEIALQIDRSNKNARLNVSFLDARGETIVAALPFELWRLVLKDREQSRSYHTTERNGRFSIETALPNSHDRPTAMIVRSFLTGQQRRIEL